MVDLTTQTTFFQNARANLGPQLTSPLGNFNITLPALSAQGTISQSAMNSLYATAAAAFPAVWTSAIQNQINALLTACGYLGTVLMPLSILAIANASGANGATVSTTVTLPNALPNTSYMVVLDAGQSCSWFISGKTTTQFVANMIPPSGSTAIAAGSFNALISS
jgi:hypothetical protein